MTTSVSKAAAPAESRRSRLGLAVIGLLAAVMAAGFGVLAAHTGQTPGIVPQTVTYDITDTSVEINYTVAKGKDDDVRCTVDAYDTAFAVLAQKEVSAPSGKSSVKGTETLQTPRRATGARIRDCRKV
ncbi:MULTISPECIES: DUF4307 domain-containing protein [Actinomadura]|jgi:hypothetical protein|uniref:DUF4307 domain-containing protein n=1 Tax=Actinomadura citrea TaxID=46158 RepID=A0A7Y9G7G6_9ACTN|nr:DUF4307 domain-containing protein [Actinomadura citrea]NYE11343.1 hypothetical protein [Actinomadura citrea]GGT76990.1 hypothetical protein GCM10010177_39020 [Actinomadura citrea]